MTTHTPLYTRVQFSPVTEQLPGTREVLEHLRECGNYYALNAPILHISIGNSPSSSADFLQQLAYETIENFAIGKPISNVVSLQFGVNVFRGFWPFPRCVAHIQYDVKNATSRWSGITHDTKYLPQKRLDELLAQQ